MNFTVSSLLSIPREYGFDAGNCVCSNHFDVLHKEAKLSVFTPIENNV